jgi:hypothetical protein
MPKASLTQVNDLSDSNSVTVQVATGIRGWRMRARLPMPNSPSSSRWTLSTDRVHSGQRSTSISVAQTPLPSARNPLRLAGSLHG